MIPVTSYAAAEIRYKNPIKLDKFERMLKSGDEHIGVWATCTETSKEGDFKRFRGVNTKRGWSVCYIDLHKKGYGYLVIPAYNPDGKITAERLTEEYIALAKQLGANELYFNGELIAGNLGEVRK